MNSWQESLKVDFTGIRSSVPLRFGIDKIFVSTLASQLYCETKVEYDVEYQPESTEIQVTGTEIHDAMIPVVALEVDDLIASIESEQEITAIFPVLFNYKGILISGIHDGVYFKNGLIKYLFEIKTTSKSRNIHKVWPGERFQAILYFLALEQMGFNVSRANIVIPKVYQEIEKQALIQPILRYLQKIDRESFVREYGEQVKIHKMSLTPLRRERALRTLDNLIHYWKEERKANYSGSYYKCRACPYREICPGSKAK